MHKKRGTSIHCCILAQHRISVCVNFIIILSYKDRLIVTYIPELCHQSHTEQGWTNQLVLMERPTAASLLACRDWMWIRVGFEPALRSHLWGWKKGDTQSWDSLKSSFWWVVLTQCVVIFKSMLFKGKTENKYFSATVQFIFRDCIAKCCLPLYRKNWAESKHFFPLVLNLSLEISHGLFAVFCGIPVFSPIVANIIQLPVGEQLLLVAQHLRLVAHLGTCCYMWSVIMWSRLISPECSHVSYATPGGNVPYKAGYSLGNYWCFIRQKLLLPEPSCCVDLCSWVTLSVEYLGVLCKQRLLMPRKTLYYLLPDKQWHK